MNWFFHMRYNYKLIYFRPPFGYRNNKVDRACKKLGMYLILWTTDSKDWKQGDNNVFCLVKKRMSRKRGGVVLLHDRKSTIDNLQKLIDYLKSLDMEFVGLKEILLYKYLKKY